MSSKPRKVSHQPTRNPSFVTPLSQYLGGTTSLTAWNRPNLLTNSITCDSDILPWFQFLRLTDREKIHRQARKIEKCCQKFFSLLRSTVFVVKDTFPKGLRMRHFADFVAYSYTACELSRYLCSRHVYFRWWQCDNFIQKTMHFLAFFHDTLAIIKWHCRDPSYNELAGTY